MNLSELRLNIGKEITLILKNSYDITAILIKFDTNIIVLEEESIDYSTKKIETEDVYIDTNAVIGYKIKI